jgi:hypothetical protein
MFRYFAALIFAGASVLRAHDVNKEMMQQAQTFIASLSDEQKARAVLAFETEERRNWHFVPKSRKGLPLKDLTPEQRKLALALLASSLSHRGYEKATGILVLEEVLAELEGPWRDVGRYYFTVFGAPGSDQPWGWRVEGHHLSLNFTAVGQTVRATPAFFGANPAEVRAGQHRGLRVLAEEEDVARALVKSLSAEQKKKAVIMNRAPSEIANVPGRNATRPQGIAWSELNSAQSQMLEQLIRVYLQRCRPEVAEEQWTRIEKSGRELLHFAWAGGLEKAEGHYYRIQGGSFVLEYDNTQDGANHVHSVWRDFDEEFGADVLAEHYRRDHAKGAGSLKR